MVHNAAIIKAILNTFLANTLFNRRQFNKMNVIKNMSDTTEIESY